MKRIVLVTGGYGFLGREVVLQLYQRGHHVIVVDAETYAARPALLPKLPNVSCVTGNILDLNHLYGADTVIHCAAETHVCNSIEDPEQFLRTNVVGTFRLLELIRAKRDHERPLCVHVSTDEVYGDVGAGIRSREADPLLPSSPYAASKVAAEAYVAAWARTYDLRVRVVRPSNCYGSGQYPEKLIPKAIRMLQLGRPIPVHGDGSQTRSWLHVEDAARAILAVMEQGEDGAAYNVPGDTEASVRDVVTAVREAYGGITGDEGKVSHGFARPGGDLRYCVDGGKLEALGWAPRHRLWTALPGIVRQEVEHGVVLV